MAQMYILGVKWPQPPGWRDAIYGKELTDEDSARFIAAKALLTKSTLRRHAKQEAATYEAAGQAIPQDLLEKLKPANTPPTNPASIRRANRKAAKKARKQQMRQIQGRAEAVNIHQPKPMSPRKASYVQPPPPNFRIPKIDPNGPEFLASFEWRTLRTKVFATYGRQCMCCGAGPEHGVVMHIDHIKPRQKRPDLALDFNNLQVLCEVCNHGKSNWDETDWRPVDKSQEDFEVAAASRLRLIARG